MTTKAHTITVTEQDVTDPRTITGTFDEVWPVCSRWVVGRYLDAGNFKEGLAGPLWETSQKVDKGELFATAGTDTVYALGLKIQLHTA